jgi:hypothetical protein
MQCNNKFNKEMQIIVAYYCSQQCITITNTPICPIFLLINNTSLKTKLGTTPMTSLCVILDSIVSAKTDPLGKRTVLLLRLCEGTLCTESLLGWLYGINWIDWWTRDVCKYMFEMTKVVIWSIQVSPLNGKRWTNKHQLLLCASCVSLMNINVSLPFNHDDWLAAITSIRSFVLSVRSVICNDAPLFLVFISR